MSDFYRCVTSTFMKKFSFSDTIMKDMSFLLPENQEDLAAAPVLRLAARFPAAVSEACDALEEELLDYTLLPSTDLPSVERVQKVNLTRVLNYVFFGMKSERCPLFLALLGFLI